MKCRSFVPIFLAILLVVSTVLAGCVAPVAPATGGAAQPVADSTEPIELTFSHFWGDPAMGAGKVVQARLDAWLAANPNVTIKTETMSHDEYYTKFRVLASSDELPDVFVMNADMTTPLVNGGQLLNLTEALNADPAWRDLQIPGGMTEWMRDGQSYALPAQMIITHLIYYNTSIFEEVGIEGFPATLEEFNDAVAKLKDAGYILSLIHI